MPEEMHSLLRRQLTRFFGSIDNVPDSIGDFVQMVNEAYGQFDDDRSMLERSLELSSQELLQANSDMRAIFQVLPDLFLRLDSEGVIKDYKAGNAADFLIEPKSLIGNRIQDIPDPEVGEIFAQAVQKMKSEKSQIRIEYSTEIRNRRIFFEARFLPLPGDETITIIRDISAIREAQRELTGREELLSATLESTADGILVVSENGIVTHSNARFAEMWRIPHDLIVTSDNNMLLNSVLDQLQNPQAFLSNVERIGIQAGMISDTIHFKDGRVFEVFVFPLKNEGIITGKVWSFRDVTERVVAEERVESLNRLKEKLLGPAKLCDKLNAITDMTISALNADFARIWVIRPGDLCDLGCVHAEEVEGVHACTNRERCLHLLASSGRYTHLDGKVHRRVPFGCYKIGRIAAGDIPAFLTNDVANDPRVHDHKWAAELGLISFAGQRILSENGDPIGVMAFFSKKPVTRDEFIFGEALANTASQVIQTAMAEDRQRELREKLDRAERMESLGILAGGVAHDLNNMLGPLVGYPELILMKLPPDSPVRKQVEKVGNAAREAAEVIQDLLTLARRGRYELQPTDLNKVVLAYLDSPNFTQLRERYRHVELTTKLYENLPYINGSATHLSKVVMNVIVNAFEAMPRGGTIKVETSLESLTQLQSGYSQIKPGDYVLLRVRDTGIGISKEDLERIFEPYYSKKQMGISGSGLGLSVVYGVVKDHNGFYDIISELGKGTEFILYFPVCQNQHTESIEQSKIVGGVESILVIDDSDEQREFASEILTGLGYRVETAVNGTEGVGFLRTNSVDLVMLDMIMEPGFDGLDTYREIIKLYPAQKAIIVSGYAATDRVEEAQKLGAGNYVRKPYTRETIARAIRQELDKNLSLPYNNNLKCTAVSIND